MQKILFKELPEFQKDFKRLVKKYPSLPGDVELRKNVLEEFPEGRGMDVAQIPGLKIKSKIYKARLACRSLRHESLRLIYSYDQDAKTIILIEIYFKPRSVIRNFTEFGLAKKIKGEAGFFRRKLIT